MNKNTKIPKMSASDLKKLKTAPLEFFERLTKTKRKTIMKILNDAYYNTDAPLVSDEIYDIINEKYADANEEVGADPQANNKVLLPVYMGSLGKIKADEKALNTFLNKFDTNFYVSEKLDGVSALLHHGKLYTRGNGEYGSDITKLVNVIQGFKKEHMSITDYSVRGEIIMAKSKFKEEYGKNRRNVVSGLVNAKRMNKKIANRVIFIAYDMIDSNGNSVEDSLGKLSKKSFITPDYITLDKKSVTVKSLSEYLEKRRTKSDYDIDGIVVKSNSLNKILTDKNPKFALAFKHLVNQDIVETIVTDVLWKVSKDGLIKPTVTFKTVNIDGVNISQATGFNAKYIDDNKVGPGAIVLIKRAGDVIPHIEKVVKPAAEAKLPTDIGYYWKSVDIVSQTNEQPVDQQNAVLLNFFKSLSVDGIGPSMTNKIREAGFSTPRLVMKMSERSFTSIPGFANKGDLYKQMQEKIKKADCITMIHALNVFSGGIGMKTLKTILEEIGGYRDMYTVSMSELTNIKGVSEITARKFMIGITKFKTYGIKCETPEDPGPSNGSQNPVKKEELGVAVFTGVRDKELEKRLEIIGVVSKTNFPKKEDYKKKLLIVKDFESKSSKMQHAIANNRIIRIILHDDIKDMSEKKLIKFLDL